ncbi:AbrB family transcriptional regulator [Burkholderia cenocepacia]|uniref:AbrB family transcriptional regulator n=1 Tax=Burkholderia cenocepacia TaxID=95486 RepID=UPI002AAF9E5B|nr:AbrB family transcriptional regulator [Burkholderia cenocepacia]
MRTVSLLTIADQQAVRIPKDLEFNDVTALEIRREGDALLLRPVGSIRPKWLSFANEPLADSGFLVEPTPAGR